MLFVGDIEKIIMLIILSQYLDKKKPVNLMLVAKSESGGSTMMKQFEHIKEVHFTSDITYSGLIDKIRDIESGNLKVLMISDYNKILSRPMTTRINFETIMNNLIEEGTKNIDLPHDMKLKLNDFVSLSLVTKVTTEMYNDTILDWYKTGFIQRFLIIKYAYDEEETKQIMNFITSNKQFNVINYKIPKLSIVKVNCETDFYDKLIPLSKEITMSYGFRIQQQLQLLLNAQALFRYIDENIDIKEFGDIEISVIEDDVKEIVRLSGYFYRPHIKIGREMIDKDSLRNWKETK